MQLMLSIWVNKIDLQRGQLEMSIISMASPALLLLYHSSLDKAATIVAKMSVIQFVQKNGLALLTGLEITKLSENTS